MEMNSLQMLSYLQQVVYYYFFIILYLINIHTETSRFYEVTNSACIPIWHETKAMNCFLIVGWKFSVANFLDSSFRFISREES